MLKAVSETGSNFRLLQNAKEVVSRTLSTIHKKTAHVFEYVDKGTKLVRTGAEAALSFSILKAGTTAAEGAKSVATLTKTAKVGKIVFQSLTAIETSFHLRKDIKYRDIGALLSDTTLFFTCIFDLIDNTLGVYLLACRVMALPQLAIMTQVGIPLAWTVLTLSNLKNLMTIADKMKFEFEIDYKVLPLFNKHVKTLRHRVVSTTVNQDVEHVVAREMKARGKTDYDLAYWREAVKGQLGIADVVVPIPSDNLRLLNEISSTAKTKLYLTNIWRKAFHYVEVDHQPLMDQLIPFLEERTRLTAKEKERIIGQLMRRNYFKETLPEIETGALAEEARAFTENYLTSSQSPKTFAKDYISIRGLPERDPKARFFRKLATDLDFTLTRKIRIHTRKSGKDALKSMNEIYNFLNAKKEAGETLNQAEVDKLYQCFKVMRTQERLQVAGKSLAIINKSATIGALALIYTGIPGLAAPAILLATAVVDILLLLYADYFLTYAIKYPAFKAEIEEEHGAIDRALRKVGRFARGQVPGNVKVAAKEIGRAFEEVKLRTHRFELTLLHWMTDRTTLRIGGRWVYTLNKKGAKAAHVLSVRVNSLINR